MRPDLRALALLYAFEASIATGLVASHKLGGASGTAWWQRGAGLALLGATGVVLACLAALVAAWRRSGGTARRRLRLTLAMNLSSVVLIAAGAELGLRSLVRRDGGDERIGRVLLLPRSWDSYAAQWRERLAALGATNRWPRLLLTYHPVLGWTVGANRAHGIYFSSAEGVRSGRPRVSLRSRPIPRHTVAVFGDSFTFGLEVSHEESWPAVLDGLLGADARVLNFGVDGYGVDQACLRYEQDAAAWSPDVVVLAMIHHDLERTMAAYSFLSFPDWGFPFANPRFEIVDGRLRDPVTPLPTPDEIFGAASISDLPRISLEPGYVPSAWERGPLDASYVVRFIRSRFPHWPEPASARDDMISLNAAVLRRFIARAAADGATPLVVYLPSDLDFGGAVAERRGSVRALEAAGVPILDLSASVRALPPPERFREVHYSPAANEAVARSLAPAIRRLLDAR